MYMVRYMLGPCTGGGGGVTGGGVTGGGVTGGGLPVPDPVNVT